jgi:hypothetical protein
MAKYDPLFEQLCRTGDGPVAMSFAEIDPLVGGLPPSAVRYPAWWGNEVDAHHVQAKAWIEAGRQVDRVDLNGQRVWFSAASWRRGS